MNSPLLLVACLAYVLIIYAADTTCGGSGIDDSARATFLSLHNDARLKMAKGQSPNLSSGKNVYKLNWDCDLESKARAYIANCPQQLPSTPGIAVNLAWSSGSIPNPVEDAAKTIKNWWAASATTPLLAPDNRYPGGKLYTFANMANGKATGLACAYKICAGGYPQKLTVACYYNLIGYYTNAIVYEKGPACVANRDCTTYPGSTCLGGLCSVGGKAGPDGGKPGPGPATKAPVVKPPKKTGPSPSCPNTLMSKEARRTFLDFHNEHRSSVVRGLEKDGLGGNAPKGSKMLKLKYDCALEKSAQAWANRCNFVHSAPAERVLGGIQNGENLWMTTALKMNKDASASQASQLWWDELKQYGVGPQNNLTDALWDREDKPIGHYTQMAWADTARIGCAIAHCPRMTFGVCHYGPSGNYMNRLIYPLGKPCSGCAAGQSCSPAEGLCIAP